MHAPRQVGTPGARPAGTELTGAANRFVVCAENLVRIDLMKESLNVGQDARADISLSDTEPREVRSQTTFSCTHGPLPFSQGSCSCRLCGRSAGPNGGGRQDLTFHHSLRSDSPI